jgi:hypothetical protein
MFGFLNPTRRFATAFALLCLFVGGLPASVSADDYVMGYQCSVDTPEMCTDPAERKRMHELRREREKRAEEAARAAAEARLERDREIHAMTKSMGMSPVREDEIRRLAEMREAAGFATPQAPPQKAPSASPKPEKCKVVPRRVTPLTPSFSTRVAAEAKAKTQVANACGVKGVASVSLNCHSDDLKRVAMKNGRVTGTTTTPYWYCAPVATCVDKVERCDSNNAPAAASHQ